MRDGGMNPRLLLVEDDPVSQAYLAEAARALPADVDCASRVAEALSLAAHASYDIWLIDAHLPDGSGAALLAQLRAAHPSPRTPAMAHTASRQPDDLAALRASGFDAVISKPLAVDEWQAAIRQGLADGDTGATWDDAGAMRALNGNADAIVSLRALFLAELPRQHNTILTALEAGDTDAARSELHRLKASCGFVGAARMRQAVDALHANPMDAAALARFDAALADTLGASAMRG